MQFTPPGLAHIVSVKVSEVGCLFSITTPLHLHTSILPLKVQIKTTGLRNGQKILKVTQFNFKSLFHLPLKIVKVNAFKVDRKG